MNNFLTKYHNLSIPIKATFWFTICNFLLKGISFITVPLFAQLLSTDEYGIVSIYNSYQQIFLIFATLELSLGAFQRGILKYRKDIYLFGESVQLLWSINTIIMFLIVLPFKDIFIKLTDTSLTVFILMFMYFIFYPSYDCWVTKKRFDYKYKPAVIATILFTLFTTMGSLISVAIIGHNAEIKITSMLILQILFCIPFYIKNINFRIIKKNKTKVIEFWRFSLLFQLPLVLHSLSYLILAQADRIMIGELVGRSEAALYSVAYSIANVVIIFQASINQVFKPWRFQKLEAHDYKSIKNITNIMITLLGTIIIVFVLVAPEIMKLLFNDEYYEAVWTIPPIALSVFFMFLYTVFTDVESYFSKTKYIMYASVICALVNIVLNFIGIYFWGYISCGYATLISYILFALLHYFFMKKIVKSENIKEKVFNCRFLIIVSILLIILMIISTLLYRYIYTRYLILVLILVSCFHFKKEIINIFKVIKT